VWWHELDEVENECTSDNFSLFVVFLSKIIKIDGNLILHSFLKHGVYKDVYLSTSSIFKLRYWMWMHGFMKNVGNLSVESSDIQPRVFSKKWEYISHPTCMWALLLLISLINHRVDVITNMLSLISDRQVIWRDNLVYWLTFWRMAANWLLHGISSISLSREQSTVHSFN